tara:strand:+ start:213 stop:1073 length:861 start_codon:yes stop_codon:yes gene_type:complete
MSKGALMFAYNNDFDYLSMADVAAGLVKKNLGIPTTVVTDEASVKGKNIRYIDNVITKESTGGNVRSFILPGSTVTTTWRNLNRSDAYELSPYQQTIMLDSDYFAFSDRLRHVFDTEHEFLCFDQVSDVTGQNTYESDRLIGKYSLPMIWATAVYFTKSEFSNLVFEFVKVIRENYRYYSLLYNFSPKPFRNDFAFSIALHTLSGYTTDKRHFFPWAMPSMTTRASVLDYRPELNEIVYEYPVGGKTYTHGVSKSRDMDLHLMNKLDVTDSNLLDKVRKYIDAETI